METKFKHTPGPWHISNKDAFIEHDGLPIAAVSMSNTEQLANSKLIAAAPELLEALDSLISRLKRHGFTNDSIIFLHNEFEKAEDAIKKATE